MEDYEQQYQDGLITQQEKYNKVIDAWSRCGDQVANAMMEEIRATPKDENGRQAQINSIYMMAHSGARGSQAQMKQLAGMRGLMAKPSGEIIETPIISNFKEGLTVLEYFNSTHGARKGLADTALKTANSGYLTRRLVDVSQDCVIVEEDCGTEHALEMRAIVQGGAVIASLGERILGRTTAEDIVDAKTGEVIVKAGTLLDEPMVKAIEEAEVQSAKIRSPAGLRGRAGRLRQVLRARPRPRHAGQHRRGGRRDRRAVDRRAGHPADDADLPHRRRGAAQRDQPPRSDQRRQDRVYRDMPTIIDKRGRRLSLARNGEMVDRRHGRPRARDPPRALRHRADVKDGAKVKEGDRLAEWDPFTLPIITEQSGVVQYQDLIEGKTMEEHVDEATGIAQRVVTEYRSAGRSKKEDLRPRLTLLGEEQGQEGRGNRGGALHARPGHRALGRGRPARRGRRHPRPCDARSRQDARHHRRSAAGGRAVRGAQAEGQLRSSPRSAAGSNSSATTRPSARSRSSRKRAIRSSTWSPRPR